MLGNSNSTGESMGKQGGLKNGAECTCDICGKLFKKIRNNQLTCSSSCRMQRDKKIRQVKKNNYHKSANNEVVVEIYQPKPHRILETDEHQREIRMAVAAKQSIYPSEVKQYVPGTPEFDEVIKQIKPIGQIRTVSALVGLCSQRKDRWL